MVIGAKINSKIKLKPLRAVKLKNQPKKRKPTVRQEIINAISAPLNGLIGMDSLITSITPTSAVRITANVENSSYVILSVKHKRARILDTTIKDPGHALAIIFL